MGSAASKAKTLRSEMVNRVVYKAVQIHGSVGYSRETDVERMYRDARVITIYEGTMRSAAHDHRARFAGQIGEIVILGETGGFFLSFAAEGRPVAAEESQLDVYVGRFHRAASSFLKNL